MVFREVMNPDGGTCSRCFLPYGEEIPLNKEKSCGAVVFTRRSGEILFVIVQEASGAYSFPKGHVEGDETEMQTAAREIREETGLRPVFLPGFRETDEFDPAEKPGTHKQVVYFLAEYGGVPLIPRQGEIRDILLLPCPEAMRRLRYEGTRRILAAADAFLSRQ